MPCALNHLPDSFFTAWTTHSFGATARELQTFQNSILFLTDLGLAEEEKENL